MKNLIQLQTALIAALLLVGCGQGFKTSESREGGTLVCPYDDCTPLPQPNPNPEDPWTGVDLDGTVSAGAFGTHKVVDIDKVNNLLLISIPLPTNPFGGGVGVEVPVPNLPGASLKVEQTSSGYALTGKIPLQYVIRGVLFTSPDKLPNGSALPGIPGGELPRLGLKIYNRDKEAYLYLGKGAVGIYVPTPQFNPYISLTFPIKNKSQRKIIGYFATVAEMRTYPGGFFMSIVLPDDIQRAIDNIIP